MEKDKHYFAVGIFVIVLFFAGLGFTLWLTSAGKGEMVEYRINFAESVSGLKVGNSVRFRGVDVGETEKIEIDPDDIRMIRVDIRVLKTTPVKTDTVASLKLQDISGDLYIELTGDNASAPELVAKNGQLPEIKAEKSTLNTIMNKLPQLLDKSSQILEKVNHIAGQVDKVFSDQNVAVLNDAIKKMASYLGVKKGKTDDQ